MFDLNYRRIAYLLIALSLVVTTPACSDDEAGAGGTDAGTDQSTDMIDEGDVTEGEDPVEDACEHLENGPFASATAVASSSEELDDVSADHTAITINLAELGDGDRGGFVELVADEDVEYFLFFDSLIDLAVTDAAGGPVSIEEEGESPAACAGVGSWFTYDLQVGTYALELGPTDQPEVTLVGFEGGDHAHEGE